MQLTTITQQDLVVLSTQAQTQIKGGQSDNAIITDITIM